MPINISAGADLYPLVIGFWLLTGGLFIIVNIAFAGGVWIDAQTFARPGSTRRRRSQKTAEATDAGPPALIFVGPWIWTLATLFGGVFIAAIYWMMHHSSLRLAWQGAQHENPFHRAV